MSFRFRLPFLCDGTTSCELLTGDDPDSVCCENKIVNNTDILINAKLRSAQNGAHAVLAPTEGANHAHLEEMGFGEYFIQFNTALVRATTDGVKGLVPVGGAVLPTGSTSLPYSKNVFEDAYFKYLEKLTILKDAGTDFILLSRQNSLLDMRAGVLAAKALKMTVFAAMQTDSDGKSENDTDYIAALVTLQSIGADAFGIYCEDTDSLCELLKRAFPHAEIPLIAVIDTEKLSCDELKKICSSGASVFIDSSCYRDKEKYDILIGFEPEFSPIGQKDSYAAATEREAFFLPDNLEISEPLLCSFDMSDELIDLDDENINAVFLELNTTDDAAFLCENARMSRLPFLIRANDEITLEAALRYYQGRLIVDSRCDIDKEVLTELSKKYGAILY